MKKNSLIISSLLIVVALLMVISGCKKDDEKTSFALSSLMAGSINMNTATPPTNVPPNPTIEAVFTVNVDPASATNNTITLVRNYDAAIIALTITVSGSKITIVPDEALGNGALYLLTFNGIRSTDDQTLSAFNRAFTTEGNFIPSGMIAYWKFENNANDQVGNFNPDAGGIVNIVYEDSYKASAGKAAFFDGTTSIIEIPNGDQLTNTNDFSISFWVKTKSAGHVNENGDPKGHFIIGLGAFYGFQFEISGDYGSCKLAAQYNIGDTAKAGQDLWFNGDGKYNINGGWKGWTYCKDLTASGGVSALLKDVWANVVCVYQSSTRIGTMYINGVKMKSQDFNLYDPPLTAATGLKWGGTPPEVYPVLAFGFIQSRQGTLWATEPWGGYTIPTSNHFGGWLDDVMIFHKPLTPVEVDLMYASAKP